jgi:hypothetical protein
MRLIPHQSVDAENLNIFLNIIDDDTAICGLCKEVIKFEKEEAIIDIDSFRPHNYFGLLTDLLDENDISYDVYSNKGMEEQWLPKDQESQKESLVSTLFIVANSFKMLAEQVYSDVFKNPYQIKFEPNNENLQIKTKEPNSILINVSGSTMVMKVTGPIVMCSEMNVVSWIVNDGSGERDISQDVDYIRSCANVFVGKINEGIFKEFEERFGSILAKNNIQDSIKSYYKILPILSASLISRENEAELRKISKYISSIYDFLSNIGSNSYKNFIGNYRNRTPIFGRSLTQDLLTLSDDIGSIARQISESRGQISTIYDVRRDSSFVYENKIMPICSECAEKIIERCDDCGDRNFSSKLHQADNKKICETCYDKYGQCEECLKMVNYDDLNFDDESDSGYCEDCFQKMKDGEIDLDSFREPPILTSDNLFFLSGNSQNLKQLSSGLYKFKEKTKGGNVLKLKQDFLNIFKANGIKEDEARKIIKIIDGVINLKITDETIPAEDFRRYIESYIQAINNYINTQEDFYSKYPLLIDGDKKIENIYSDRKIQILNNYQPIPVLYEYDRANRGNNNFVIKMMPSSLFFKELETLFSDIAEDAWAHFSNSGTQHHPGCIAYARISYDGENFVIDNLQRDADLNNAMGFIARIASNPQKLDAFKTAFKWIEKRISKWYVQFADYLIDFAKRNNKKLYLTNFQTQKAKWRTIPEKNVEVYDNLPEELSSAAFYKKLEQLRRYEPEETVESLHEKIRKGLVEVFPTKDNDPNSQLRIEDLKKPVDGIWRLAKKNRILGLFKKSK